RDAHLRTDHDRIRNITGAAGIDHILQVRLDVTPLGHLKPMPDFQHLLGICEVAPGDVNTARVITTKITVDKMQHRPVVIAPGEQAFVMEADVHLEWHDRDLRLRIISGSDKHVQPLVAARRLLINHLVAVNIEAVGMTLKAATETTAEMPLRASNPNVGKTRHSLQPSY